MLVFAERGKERTNNKLNPDVAQMPGCELGSNWWEAGALYTALPLLPNKYYNKNNANIKLQKNISLLQIL